jgi:dTDP-4-amino-4,6-dideoxygalactose transaminase
LTEDLAGRLLRLPLFYTLTESEQDEVCTAVSEFLQR